MNNYNEIVENIFEKIRQPFLTSTSFKQMFDEINSEVDSILKKNDFMVNNLILEGLFQKLSNLSRDREIFKKLESYRSNVSDSTESIASVFSIEIRKFIVIEVLRKVIDENFMSISSISGFKQFMWEFLDSKGYSYKDIFYK